MHLVQAQLLRTWLSRNMIKSANTLFHALLNNDFAELMNPEKWHHLSSQASSAGTEPMHSIRFPSTYGSLLKASSHLRTHLKPPLL
ncbi:hypothetical protein M5689_020547 [Euphorbia peplus]|nr:hypothetical protein M5689_020547 [Euphorbia peplus]